jgi:hypothetical protein
MGPATVAVFSIPRWDVTPLWISPLWRGGVGDDGKPIRPAAGDARLLQHRVSPAFLPEQRQLWHGAHEWWSGGDNRRTWDE